MFSRFVRLTLALTVLSLSLASFHPVSAAEFYTGDTVTTSAQTSLDNAYIAAGTVNVTHPVANDLTVAGGTVTIDTDIAHNLQAVGGTITIDGSIGHNARIAGGTVTINGQIEQDLIVAGGNIIINPKAEINGDVVVFGGTVNLQAAIKGKVWASGGQITMNNTTGPVEISSVTNLTIGPDAEINGNLTYTSPNQAQISDDAIIRGDVDFTRGGSTSGSTSSLNTASFFYNLIASTIFCLALLFLFRRVVNQGVNDTRDRAGSTFLLGLAGILLGLPVALISLLLSAWLGIALILLYVLVLITGYFIGQLILGWWLLSWWFGRTQQQYWLDWRAIVIGVLVSTILMFVPVFGWLVLLATFILGVGSLFRGLWRLNQPTSTPPPTSPALVAQNQNPSPTTSVKPGRKSEATAATPSKTKSNNRSASATKATDKPKAKPGRKPKATS